MNLIYYFKLLTVTLLSVCDNHGSIMFVDIKIEKILQFLNGESSEWRDISYFYYQHTKYVWDASNFQFSTINAIMTSQTVDDYLNNHEGLVPEEYQNR